MDHLLGNVAFQLNTQRTGGVIEEPQTGEEYLHNVMIERLQCPETQEAPPALHSKQNVFIQQPEKAPSPYSLLPTEEWQAIQEANFSQLRCNISRLYNSKTEWPVEIVLPFIERKVSHELWTQFMEEHLPQLSIVFTMSQPVLEYVLDRVLIENLDDVQPGETISRNCGSWLYAVLALLRLPLAPEVHSSLRELVTKCQLIRSRLNEGAENLEKKVNPLNLLICLVARYFRQGDLRE